MGLFNLVPSINWGEESYPEYADFVVLPFFALFFPSIRLLLDRFVFEKLGKRLIFGKGPHDPKYFDVDKRKNKVRKFKESAWKFVYFLSAEMVALYVTYNEPWFTDTKYFWEGPGDQRWPDLKMKLKLKGHYMYVAGFYIYSIFALLFWETKRKDFGVSMGHHVASITLIVLSYIFRFSRVGSIVLAVHDGNDIFLETGKMSKYSGAETLASIAFVLFAISWLLLRVIYYSLWVLWSTSYEVVETLDNDKSSLPNGPLYYYIFNTLLYTILMLDIYWWVLIWRMLVDQVKARGKVTDDIRSDSEGEDEHED